MCSAVVILLKDAILFLFWLGVAANNGDDITYYLVNVHVGFGTRWTNEKTVYHTLSSLSVSQMLEPYGLTEDVYPKMYTAAFGQVCRKFRSKVWVGGL